MCELDKLYQNNCAVRGCSTKRRQEGKEKIPFHRFPKRGNAGLDWITACGNEDLLTLDYTHITQQKYFVCHRHFAEESFYRKRNGNVILKHGVIPTKELPTNTSELPLRIDLTSEKNAVQDKNLIQIECFSPLVGNMSTLDLDKKEERLENLRFSLNSIHNEMDIPVEEGSREQIKENTVNTIVEEDNGQPSTNPMDSVIEEENAPQCKNRERASTPKKNRLVHKKAEAENFSPQKKRFLKQVDLERSENNRLKKKLKRSEERLQKVKQRLQSKQWNNFGSELNTVQKLFIDMIIKNHSKHPNSRRYTNEEKIIALSIYKTSAKCYRYLKSIIHTLPSISTLKTVMKNIPMDTGVNEATKQRLKDAAAFCKSDKDKVMIVMWDELMLSAGLHYDKDADKIVGFEDFGCRRNKKYADHAMVFMLRSVKSGDNLPICFNFCDSQTTSDQLQECLKEVVKAATDAGFRIIASVCDGARTNESAIMKMIEQTKRIKGEEYVQRYGTYIIRDVEIIPLFDPPHLLKCMRNNLLDKDLEFDYHHKTKSSKKKVCDWQHVIAAYEIDVFGNGRYRSMKKLTDKHVYPANINKMSVKKCYQVFSGSVASTIQALAGGPEWETSLGNRSVTVEGKNTAEVLAFFNKVADAFNGKVSKDHGSEFRTLMDDNSFHNNFFNEAKEKLNGMRFVEKGTHKPLKQQPPSLKNLKKTINNTQLLWKKLKDLGFKNLKTKHLNQDPLENFFGLIRSQGSTNTKPTCYQFIGHYKALVVNNLTKYHALDANCADDEGNLLLPWQNYLSFVDDSKEKEITLEKQNCSRKSKIIGTNDPIPEKGKIANELCVILKEIKSKVPSLDSCFECMKFLKPSSVRSKGAAKNLLEEIHNDIVYLLQRILTSFYNEDKIRARAFEFLLKEVRTEAFSCKIHGKDFLDIFLHSSIKLYIRTTSAFLTSILKGDVRFPPEAESHERNIFVLQAIRKYRKSLKSKHTYSTLSRNISCQI